MKRLLCTLLALTMLFPAAAIGESRWLIEDSNTRALTEKELWLWDYESLGYILHEIYARHGYLFAAGSRYETYFTQQDWYSPNEKNNLDGCFSEMTELEWQNAELVQTAMQQMMRQGNLNLTDGRSLWSNEKVIAPLGFTLTNFGAGQQFKVYSAPSTKAYRGAKGKALVDTTGEVWAAGWVDGWLLIYYETNKGAIRVGYISAESALNSLNVQNQLTFAGTPAKITQKCKLTDDPAREASSISTLKKGAKVTYLTTYFLEKDWAYIETKYNKKTVRAFVPLDCIEMIEE